QMEPLARKPLKSGTISKGGGFSGSTLSNLPGVRGTTWLAARILGRMDKLDCVGYATTRSHGTLDAHRTDIGTPHDIARSLISAPAAVGTPMLRPFSAYGARLRRVGFLDLGTGCEFIVQQVDQFAVA